MTYAQKQNLRACIILQSPIKTLAEHVELTQTIGAQSHARRRAQPGSPDGRRWGPRKGRLAEMSPCIRLRRVEPTKDTSVISGTWPIQRISCVQKEFEHGVVA
eukprot:1141947-Pelagomonas_calceolata.AAC.3